MAILLSTALVSAACNSTADFPEFLPELPIENTDAEVVRVLRRQAPPDPSYCLVVAEPMSVNTLVSFIQACGITTIEDLLPRLPEAFRRDYTFMRRSDSAQEASAEFPRAIIFGDGKFILSFNGGPAQFGFDRLEIIEWDSVEKKFRPHDFTFGVVPISSLELPVQWTQNPGFCFGCHGGGTFRPNWAGYNMWEGTFGSVTRRSKDAMNSTQSEAREYEEFLKGERWRGRYAALPGPTTPVEIESIYEPDAPAHLSYAPNGSLTHGGDPNNQMLNRLTDLNHQRIGKELTLHPNYERFKKPLAALISGCVDLCLRAPTNICGRNFVTYDDRVFAPDQLYPASYASEYRSFEEHYEEVYERANYENENRRLVLQDLNTPWLIAGKEYYLFRPYTRVRGEDSIQQEPQRVSAALQFFAERAGVQPWGWSLAFRDGTDNLFSGDTDARAIFG